MWARASSCCSAGSRSEKANSHRADLMLRQPGDVVDCVLNVAESLPGTYQFRDGVLVTGQGCPAGVGSAHGGPLSRSRRCRDTSAPLPSGARHYHTISGFAEGIRAFSADRSPSPPRKLRDFVLGCPEASKLGRHAAGGTPTLPPPLVVHTPVEEATEGASRMHEQHRSQPPAAMISTATVQVVHE